MSTSTSGNMKNIFITVEAPPIPATVSITHTGTSYQISKRPDFTAENLLVDIVNDSEHLVEYDITLPILETATVYVRTKFHFTDSTDPLNPKLIESGWSRIASLRANQRGLLVSDVIVGTPRVKTKVDYLTNGTYNLTITTTDFKMFAGPGEHGTSSWLITDTDGKVIFKREFDDTNLTSLVINSKDLPSGKLYTIKVSHQSSTNVSSYDGVACFTDAAEATKYYTIDMIGRLTANRKLWFRLNSYTHLFESFDICIRDRFGYTVLEQVGQKTMTPTIFPTGLSLYENYKVYGRMKLSTGTYTPYTLISDSILEDNYIIQPSPFLNYLGKYDFNQELLLNSQTAQISHELYQGSILLSKHNSKHVYRCRIRNGKLVETGKVFELPVSDNVGLPHVNFIPLRNGHVIVNYAPDHDGVMDVPSVFEYYKHNAGSNTFTLINAISNPLHMGSTGISGSCVVSKDNTVYFVPAIELDSNKAEQNLSLYKFVPGLTMSITKVKDLPFSAKRFVSLALTNDDKIIISGGVDTSGVVEEVPAMMYYRTNNDIFSFDIATQQFTKLLTLADIPTSVYNFHTFVRPDGKMVMFNSVRHGSALGNQRTITVDLVNNTYVYDNNDMSDGLGYRSSVVLQNGDFLRISSLESDPQVVYRYVGDTMVESQLDENTEITTPIKNLVVNAGEVITIEDPYVYDTITVKGTSMNDTGMLRWVKNDNVVDFYYDDIIFTRSTKLDYQSYNALQMASLHILDGVTVQLEMYEEPNILIVPFYQRVEITDPYQYTKIIIEGNTLTDTGTLIWHIEDEPDQIFDFRDLVLTRTTVMSRADFEAAGYKSVATIDGARLIETFN